MATTLEARHHVALAIARIVVGAVFIAHGAQKLFVFGPTGIGGYFASIGVPASGVMGPFIGGLEFFGGIALVVGLLARLAGLGLFCDMLGAITFVHFRNGFFLPKGYEFVMTLGLVALAIAVGGAGAYSLDAVIARRRRA
jgi:putative oxidoreductase